jgi:hypothetical protein
MAPVIAQMSPASQGEGQLLKHPLRGCLKSPDSVKFGDYTRSFQLPNTWAESYARTVSVEISGLFKHPLKQAHERIIGERQVANDEKLLSLFEPNIHVIARGKAGAEVEFGNLLVLGEQIDGLIMDWELFKEQVPADPRLVRPSVERAESGLQVAIRSLVTDRGFDNKINVKWLEERGTFVGLCPRDPRALREAMKDQHFAQAQHRRAQTEGRIAIFKNEFLGRPMRSEGFENRALQVAWGVLTHNLWVLAEKLREQRKILEQKLRQAA